MACACRARTKKVRLEGILGIMLVVQQPPAHSKDKRTMSLDQDGKGRFVPVSDEALDELPILKPSHTLAPQEAAQMLQNGGRRCSAHKRIAGESLIYLLLLVLEDAKRANFFCSSAVYGGREWHLYMAESG